MALAGIALGITLVPLTRSFIVGGVAVTAVLALAALPSQHSGRAPLGRGFYLAIATLGAAFVLFWGPEVRSPGHATFAMPFKLLWLHAPGFDGIRAIRRIALIMSLALCAAAAPA